MHLSDTQFEALRAQRLNAAELPAVLQHLAACAACRARAETTTIYPALHQALLADTEAAHLSFEQLADWVEGRLTDDARSFAHDHLAQCLNCRAAADDLRAFSLQVADQFNTEIKPAAVAVEQPAPWQRWRAWLIAPLPLTAAAVLTVGAVSWLMFNQRSAPTVTVLPVTPTVTVALSPEVMPSPAALLAQLNDGGATLALDAQGNLQGASDWPERYRRLAQQTLQGVRLSRSSALDGLDTASAALMGQENQAGFALREPVGKVVATERPTLRWQPLVGAESYQVELVNERYEIVAHSEPLTQTVWQAPQALRRGRVYGWQVKATRNGEIVKAPLPPAPLARFRVLGEKEWAEIQTARARFAPSHLLLGQLYAQAGLLEEAEGEFRALQKTNPNSPIPSRLLNELRKVKSDRVKSEK